jgi:NAD(P)-dependent dehydrogenase (short-subunit alcohol dehydrogenase family)
MLLAPLHRLIVRAADAPVVDLTGKRIIVTGAATGSIGGETARILSDWGADVITTNRSGNGVSHALDLGDAESVRTFAAWVRETTGDHVDVLVNNAAILLDLMRSWKEPRLLDGHESMWRVNFLGTMHLTTLLLPALSGGRVVNVVSTSHKRARNADLFGVGGPYNSYRAYGTSKLALMHLTGELDRRHPETEFVSVHPGEVYTGIASAALADHTLILAARNAMRPLEQFITMTATEGAQTQVLLASAPTVERRAYYVRCKPATASAELKDTSVSARLWDQTQEWLASQARIS